MGTRRRSFTLTELLVVIALIALLAGLLLAALGKVQVAGKRTTTLGTMQAFVNSCHAFKAEHGFYPGLIPEHVLAYHNHTVAHGEGGTAISGTENALLHLLGGYAVVSEISSQERFDLLAEGWLEYSVRWPPRGGQEPEPFRFLASVDRMGAGPVIGGKSYGPYLSPEPGALRLADAEFGQWGVDEESTSGLPDLVDAWGNPIIYIRRARDIGLLTGSAHGETIEHAPIKPMIYVDNLWPYVRAEKQLRTDDNPAGSILSTEYAYGYRGFAMYETEHGLAAITRTDAVARDAFESSDLYGLTPRGDVMVISAGADGIYYSATDGPGSEETPIGSPEYTYTSGEGFIYEANDDLTIIDQFDDIRISG